MATKRIGIVRGDGIGPEIIDEGLRFLTHVAEKTSFDFETVELLPVGEADRVHSPFGEQVHDCITTVEFSGWNPVRSKVSQEALDGLVRVGDIAANEPLRTALGPPDHVQAGNNLARLRIDDATAIVG